MVDAFARCICRGREATERAAFTPVPTACALERIHSWTQRFFPQKKATPCADSGRREKQLTTAQSYRPR